MSKKILYISKNAYISYPIGGRELLSKQNLGILKQIFKKNFFVYKLKQKKLHSISEYLYTLLGHIDGINSKVLKEVCSILEKNKISHVFLDGSNLGQCAKIIKKKYPKIKIISYFHNLETKFFFDNFIKLRTFKSFFILISNFLAELKAIKYSNYRICLTNEDSNTMQKVFLKRANFISPLTMRDTFSKKLSEKSNKINKKYILFVGGNFYGNLNGIKWYIKNIAPFVKIKTIIIGRGYKNVDYLKKNNVSVLHNIKNLNTWYINAHFVIAPIFKGSGMKTKIAEALMHGKLILGTSFVATGYRYLNKNTFYKCNTKRDFINSINKLSNKKLSIFNSLSRNLYCQKFSTKAGIKNFRNIFMKI